MTDQEIIKKLKEGKTVTQLQILNKVDPKRSRRLRNENNIPKPDTSWRGNILKA